MRPVEQTICDLTRGNCIAASIASVLELPINQVPNFVADPTDDWWAELQRWLLERTGCQLLALPADVARREVQHTWPGTWCLLSYSNGAGVVHACVGRVSAAYEIELMHNPWPGRRDMAGWTLEEVKFFVRVDPMPNTRCPRERRTPRWHASG